MKINGFKIWFIANKMLVNATVLGYHVHAWMWGFRIREGKPKHFHYLRVWRVCNITFFDPPNSRKA